MKQSVTCPNCGLLGPRDSVCDCGHNHMTGYMQQSYLNPKSEPRRERSAGERFLRGAVLFFALAPLRAAVSIGADNALAGGLAVVLTAGCVYLWWRFVWR